MRYRAAVLTLALCLVPFVAFAQSADQAISVTDAPDPIVPGNNITYSITVTNNGPDPAVNGGFNASLGGGLIYQSTTAHAGFTCFVGFGISCTNPSFPAGQTANFTLVAQVDPSLLNFPDGSITSNFSTSGVTTDPVAANNSTSATTSYDSPQIDMTIGVTDSPDPVFPDNDITYTVVVSNAGPDTAINAHMNTFNNGTLQFQSATQPAGWSCVFPSVGSAPTFTCTAASFAGGSTSTFTVVVRASSVILGANDGTVQTNFSANATGNDTNHANESETENTAYVTPDADMTVAVTDSPDPVTPNNDITYTVTVGNTGPDAAPTAHLNVFNNGTLRFQSVTAPAGWSCAAPSVGSTPTFTCTNPSFASGSSVVFTVVVRADSTILGINDGTVSTNFSVNSSVADPDNSDNSETEDTAYVTPDADLHVTNSDAPDPVASGATITYTQVLTNQGPDAAPNATLSEVLPASVGFQSIIAPAGFTCTTPAVGASGTISCTNPSLANGGGGTFTIVVNVIAASGTVTNTVVVGSNVQDPDNPDNSAMVTTQIIAPPSADLVITKSTNATSAAPGSNITYTITLTNNGPDAASTVSMTDTLPASLRFQSITQPAGFTCTTPAVGASGTITCSATTLANGATATFTLVAQVAGNATVSVTNTAGVSSATSDPNGGNSSGTAPAVVVSSADLSIVKSTNATSAPSGSIVNYTITVTNAGPSTATNVVVSDPLPPSLQLITATPSQGSCSGTTTVTCNLGTILNGANATIALSVRVLATSGTVSNSASVIATESDPNGGNNASTSPAIPVTPAEVAEEDVPTLSEWALIAFVVLLGFVAVRKM